jgi:hypothetical protein
VGECRAEEQLGCDLAHLVCPVRGVNGLFLLMSLLLSPTRGRAWLMAGDFHPPCFTHRAPLLCALDAPHPRLWVAPWPGVGSVAAFSNEGFVMLKSG